MNGRSSELAFLTAVTPGQMLFNFPNRYYPSDEAYLEAVGEALRFEYLAIVDAGLSIQLDSPDLAMRGHFYYPGAGPEEMNKYIPMVIEALNHATRGIPADKMRLHLAGAIIRTTPSRHRAEGDHRSRPQGVGRVHFLRSC